MDSLKIFATITGQRSLTAGLLKIGLSDSDWLKIKCNNSIGSGGVINNLNQWGGRVAINLIGGVKG